MGRRKVGAAQGVSRVQAERARIRANRPRGFNLKGFVIKPGSPSNRMAEFLDWCARKYPYEIITYPEILQAVQMLSKAPPPDAAGVKSAIDKIRDPAAKILRSRYGRVYYSTRGVGARASVDDADVLEFGVPRMMRRCGTALDRAEQVNALVDSDRVDTQILEEQDPYRRETLGQLNHWRRNAVNKALTIIGRSTVQAALKAPAPAQPDPDEPAPKGSAGSGAKR